MPLSTGYFLGSFNPVHLGHLWMAECARIQFGFERIVWVPAFAPPHRQQEKQCVAFHHRLNMVRLACRGNPHFMVSNIESQRPGPSYTIDTLRALIPDFGKPDNRISLIMGTDTFNTLPSWHQAEQLIPHVTFVVARRENLSLAESMIVNNQRFAVSFQTLNMPPIGISASLIRDQIAKRSINRYTLPKAVLDYIQWNQLYTI